MEKKLQKACPPSQNLLIRLRQAQYQVLLIILVKNVIKLDINIGMIIENKKANYKHAKKVWRKFLNKKLTKNTNFQIDRSLLADASENTKTKLQLLTNFGRVLMV